MPTETIEAPTLTKIYICTQYPQLRLVMTPGYDRPLAAGEKLSANDRSTFQPGRYILFGPPGGHPPHRYETADPEEQEFLDNHESNGSNPQHKSATFREVTAEVPKPDASDTLSEIAAYAALRDREKIEEIRDAELKGYMRESVLGSAEAALKGIEAAEKASETEKKPGKVKDDE